MRMEALNRLRMLTEKAKRDKEMPTEEVLELFEMVPGACDHIEYLQDVLSEVTNPNYKERSIQ